MIILKDGERLYPASWEFNACRITTELARIITDNGGIVAPQKSAIISNRTADAAISEYAERISEYAAHLEKTNDAERRARLESAIREYRKKLEAAQARENGPFTTTHNGYITFALDGMYYSLSTDSNPFFDFHFWKTPIRDGKRSRDACGECFDKSDWLTDDMITRSASSADIREAANIIFNRLLQAPQSEIRRDSTRRRVANTYNNGYHYETVYAPEHVEKLDWITA